VVVDDHELVRSGICNALDSSLEISVVGQAGDGLAALGLLEWESVDVLILDLHMPRMDGISCLEAVKTRWPELPVIVLTVEEDPAVALDVIRRGAAAYVPKFVRPGDLAFLVRQVASGAVIIGGNRLTGALTAAEPAKIVSKTIHGLTEREMEVLDLVAQGKSNSDIAGTLFVTTKTVKYHLTGIFSKLGVRNRTEAAAFAINNGLVFPQQRRPSLTPRVS
jgi:NarL family two-component system response regulator LiaR